MARSDLLWIDETAMHRGWTIRPLKSLFSFSKGLNITKEDLCEEGTAVVSYGQIHSKNYHGTGIEEPIVRFVPSSKAAGNVQSRVEIGGFLFADTSEDLEGIGNCAYNDSADELYGGYHTIVLNPKLGIHNKYFAYLFQADAWRSQLRRDLIEVKVYSVTQSALKRTHVPFPPLEEQQRIAGFLDRRCAVIDAEKAALEDGVAALRRLRTSTIHHAVTRGIDANVAMKETGRAWLPLIPKHWTLEKLSYFSASSLGKMIDQKLETGVNVHEYLSNRDVNWFSINTDGLATTSFPLNCESRYGIRDGDILICEGGDVGRCCVWRGPSPDFYFQKAIHRLRVNPHVAVPEYIAYQMFQKAKVSEFREVRKGEATFSHLPGDQLDSLRFAMPPLEEQKRIVAYIDDRCAAIDSVIEARTKQISRLEDYRKALIFQYVTGKKEVPHE